MGKPAPSRHVLPMARAHFIALLALGTACGASDDGGGGDPTACGVSGAADAACARLEDCGGAGNVGTVSFCEHCPPFARTEFCRAGKCEAFSVDPSIDIEVLALPDEAAGAQSIIVAVLEPVMADGTVLSCEGLLAPACSIVANGALNASNVKFQTLSPPAQPGLVYRTGSVSAPGPGKLVLVRATSESQGRGQLLAEGCVEGVDVPSTGRVTVPSMTLDRPRG